MVATKLKAVIVHGHLAVHESTSHLKTDKKDHLVRELQSQCHQARLPTQKVGMMLAPQKAAEASYQWHGPLIVRFYLNISYEMFYGKFSP